MPIFLFLVFSIILLTCQERQKPSASAVKQEQPPMPLQNDALTYWNPDRLGALWNGSAFGFRVQSESATDIQLHLFKKPTGEQPVLVIPMQKSGARDFHVTISQDELAAAGLNQNHVFYGYRAFGPNWPLVDGWTPGSLEGFISDVDQDGNRFNPNKLLVDPYALEISHDPIFPGNQDGTIYASGDLHRIKNSGPMAPKSIAFKSPPFNAVQSAGNPLTRAFKDEVIYEVHLRGFTMNDPSISSCRGTYKAAGMKAAYLKELGVTAVEFLPLQETVNDANDVEEGTPGDNYWGYMTLGYFAPDRRYSCDKSPGGPTRELKEMVSAFHVQGIKVYLDVVYNHTAGGGSWGDPEGKAATIQSFRGLDNASYYQLASDKRFFTTIRESDLIPK